MQETTQSLKNKVKELEQYFAGRLAGAIEVKYGSIHLELLGNLSSDDVDTVFRILDADSKEKRWRVQQVDNLLLLQVTTEASEWD